jgi:hypothetical protein
MSARHRCRGCGKRIRSTGSQRHSQVRRQCASSDEEFRQGTLASEYSPRAKRRSTPSYGPVVALIGILAVIVYVLTADPDGQASQQRQGKSLAENRVLTDNPRSVQ